jgi:divalent metal cation (Fe/Co/Zn/Cd) transporter
MFLLFDVGLAAFELTLGIAAGWIMLISAAAMAWCLQFTYRDRKRTKWLCEEYKDGEY